MRELRAAPLFLVLGLTTACGGSDAIPTASQPPSTTTTSLSLPVQLAVFSDPASTLMTSDVHDVDEQTVQFNTNNHSLIWVADGRSFPGYTVNGYFINADFQVRFGAKDGQRRAYFTETVKGTVCNIEIVNGAVVLTSTDVPVPGGNSGVVPSPKVLTFRFLVQFTSTRTRAHTIPGTAPRTDERASQRE